MVVSPVISSIICTSKGETHNEEEMTMSIVKHYRTYEEAKARCDKTQKVIAEGNADVRYRVVAADHYQHGAGTRPDPRVTFPFPIRSTS
jgi:hypothetical protein